MSHRLAVRTISLLLCTLLFTACGNNESSSQSSRLKTVATATYAYPEADTSTTLANFPANESISVVFSKAMDPATITGATFTLADASGVAVAGTVSYDPANRIASFRPAAPLTPGQKYTATLHAAIKDLSTNTTISNSSNIAAKTWSFTAGAADPALPLLVGGTSEPAGGSTGVALTTGITATFDHPMDSATITATSFTVNDGAADIAGTVSYDPKSRTASFAPYQNLKKSTVHTVTLAPTIKAASGSAFAGASWSFTTGSGIANAYVSNIDSNTLSSFSIAAGVLTFKNEVAAGYSSTPVSATIDPAGRFLYSVLKGRNKVEGFRVYSSIPTPPTVSAATAVAPQAIAFTPDGRHAYVTNSASNTISAYTVASGTLTRVTGKTFATGTTPTSLAIDRTGRFAYVSNYAGNTLSAFAIDAATGDLTAISGSPYPTGVNPGMVICVTQADGSTLVYVANYGGNTVSGFKVNPLTGALTAVTPAHFTTQTGPYALAATPDGSFLYVANYASNSISGYSIDPASGVLTPVAGSPFDSLGVSPRSLAFSPSGEFLYAVNATSSDIASFLLPGGILTPLSPTPIKTGGTTPFSIVVK